MINTNREMKIAFFQYFQFLGNLYPFIICQIYKTKKARINLSAAEKNGGESSKPNFIPSQVEPQTIPNANTPR